MMVDVPPEPSYEQVIEHRLSDCGLDSSGVSVRYEDYLQSVEIRIAPSAGAKAEQFECIRQAAGYEIVTFEDPDMYAAYTDHVSEQLRPGMMASMERQLKESDLWENFPSLGDYESLEDFSVALEEHAGLEAHSTLKVADDGIQFDPPDEDGPPADFVERYSKLIAVVSYASMQEGLSFGFLGNERARD